MRRGVTVLGLAVLVGAVLTGCASRSRPVVPAAPAAAPVVAPCAAFHCVAGPAEALSGGYAARLWSSPPPASGIDRSVPVVELLRAGTHQSWWTGRLGTGWSAQLTCLDQGCVVTSGLGLHGGVAESLLLGAGALTAPATASVEFDSGLPVVRDLDGDGRLDVVGTENDYQPNFAQGHNYWATYRLVGRQLVRTGCLPVAGHTSTPRTLLSGPCPSVPGSA